MKTNILNLVILTFALSGSVIAQKTDNIKDSLKVTGDLKVDGYIVTKHIKSPDGVIHLGDSSMTLTTYTNQTNPITGATGCVMEGQSTSSGAAGMGLGWGTYSSLGTKSMAIGNSAKAYGDYCVAVGNLAEADANFSTAIGYNVKVSGTGPTYAIAMGSGYVSNPMVHSVTQSLGIGFNSTVPTFFVGPGNGTSGSIGKVGIGTTTPAGLFEVKTKANSGSDPSPFIISSTTQYTGVDSKLFEVTYTGAAYAREIFVKVTAFPDYVFNKDYKLLPLTELDKFISSNHHLPKIPSAKEVQEKGQNVGEIQVLQMEKIEELTLYLIEMNKKMDEMKQENINLQKKVSQLELQIKK